MIIAVYICEQYQWPGIHTQYYFISYRMHACIQHIEHIHIECSISRTIWLYYTFQKQFEAVTTGEIFHGKLEIYLNEYWSMVTRRQTRIHYMYVCSGYMVSGVQVAVYLWLRHINLAIGPLTFHSFSEKPMNIFVFMAWAGVVSGFLNYRTQTPNPLLVMNQKFHVPSSFCEHRRSE